MSNTINDIISVEFDTINTNDCCWLATEEQSSNSDLADYDLEQYRED